MKKINITSGNYIFVKIPKGASDIFTKDYRLFYKKWSKKEDCSVMKMIFLSKNREDTFEILSTSQDITEEQAEGIVEKRFIPNQPFIVGRETYFKQYGYTRKGWDFPYHTAKESLQSLIQANGLDITKNYLILKKL